MPRNVAVVFTPDYADELESLAFRAPVWIADTPPNRGAAENAWRAANDWPHISVTLFRAPQHAPSVEDWRALLDQIALHEKAIEVLEVIGSPLTDPTHKALVERGFEKIEDTRTGFRAWR